MMTTELDLSIRTGRLDDAAALAALINYAGEGMPLYLWERMAEPGETAWQVGERRARRTEGSFSYLNARVADLDGSAAGCLIGYPLPDTPETIDYAELQPMFAPLQRLEDQAPGTWYVNVLAVMPQFRNRGVGRAMIEEADRMAASSNRAGLSLIVADANHGARRLYQRVGFTETASQPMVKEDWQTESENWILMVRA